MRKLNCLDERRCFEKVDAIVLTKVDVICYENHLRTTRISNNNACLVFVDSGVVTANCNIIEPDADRSEDAPLIQGNKYSNKYHCCLNSTKRGMN